MMLVETLRSIDTLTLTLSSCVLGSFLVYCMTKRTQHIPKGLRLPPGPRATSLLGNISELSSHHVWENITRWSKQYGDLFHMSALGVSVLYINSLEVAHDLFESRSSLYADRPVLEMFSLTGFDHIFAFMQYGHHWRRHRKLFHEYFNPKEVTAYDQIQFRHSRLALQKIHDEPNGFVDHFRHLAAAVVMEVLYGIQLQPKNDRYIYIARLAQDGASEAVVPGAFLVDMFPILKHVPEWMPGAGFKRKAKTWREPTMEMMTAPFMVVKNALAEGTGGPSVVASALKKLSGHDNAENEEEIIRNVGGTAYVAGTATSATVLTSFILAMVLYPETQRKAQVELDAVIGEDRLPTFEDRANLPYVSALCEEIQRWRPVLPLAIPHVLSSNDVYKEYFLPKGSLVVGNAWGILHNEATYGPRPDNFEPERFLKPGVIVPTAQYGYGRRMCPGRFLAEKTIFIVVVHVLKVFDISPARDANGYEIPIAGTYTAAGSIMEPDPFKCSFKVRSESAKRLIAEQIDI